MSLAGMMKMGNSAARTLIIRTPITGARLSSSFGTRKHPVSGFNAMHKGVDFAAPKGTPIIAAGSGVIREAWLEREFWAIHPYKT